MFTLISHWRLHGFGIRLCILIVRFEAQSDAEMAGHDYQNQAQLQNHLWTLRNGTNLTYMFVTDLVPFISLYNNSRGNMMVEEWKHQTSKPKFRGNFKLTFLTCEHRRLPVVLDNDSFRAKQSIYRHKISFSMVVVVKLHVFSPLQVHSIVGIRDPSSRLSHL
jgi:hypothetical protein